MTHRPPKQDGSRRTLDRLAESALNLMAKQGVEATSVAEIVARARSSVGSFYARFDGKSDFVRFLEDRVWDDATHRWDSAVERIADRELGTEELVTGVVRLLVETGAADLDRRRVLGTASGSPERAEEFYRHVESGITGLLLDRRADFGHPDPRRAIGMGYRVIVGAVDQLSYLQTPSGPSEYEDVVAELAQMYLAYLQSTPSPSLRRKPSSAMQARTRVERSSEASPATAEAAETGQSPSRPETERVDFFDVWG
jgi:AcrR family transcriptional regulator